VEGRRGGGRREEGGEWRVRVEGGNRVEEFKARREGRKMEGGEIRERG
jgi:hypothetical protein